MEGNQRVTVLIPCAGNGERYNIAGLNPAEYPPVRSQAAKHLMQVEWDGEQRPMVGHVIRRLPAGVGRVMLGVRPQDYHDSYMLPVAVCQVVDSLGQADTVRQMLDAELAGTDGDGPCLVLNCDALLPTVAVGSLIYSVTTQPAYCMACAVQFSTNLGMSYVDQVPHPTRFLEKQRLSSFGMSGAWAFRSMRELRSAVQTSIRAGDCHSNGEVYLSHALNHLPGPHVAWQIGARDVVDWNTPEALASSGARIKW